MSKNIVIDYYSIFIVILRKKKKWLKLRTETFIFLRKILGKIMKKIEKYCVV